LPFARPMCCCLARTKALKRSAESSPCHLGAFDEAKALADIIPACNKQARQANGCLST
jgi:hypothetical protein